MSFIRKLINMEQKNRVITKPWEKITCLYFGMTGTTTEDYGV
jgi:hypothetical protein